MSRLLLQSVRVVVCALVLSGFALPTARPQAQTLAHPAHKRAEREEIEEMEQQFQKAQLSGDVTIMDKLLSDDYLGINANGELTTKTQQLDHMRNRSLIITRLSPSDVKIKLIGQTAIVTSEVQVEGTLDGTTLHGQYRYTRVYQRVANGSWKVTNFEVTRIRRPTE